MLKEGQKGYQTFCAECHADNGEGKKGPSIKGSKVATGPLGEHINVVLSGHHMEMPSWGLTQLSDDAIAQIITFQRNSWGNNDTQKFGEQAGGAATPELVKSIRDKMGKKTEQKNVRT